MKSIGLALLGAALTCANTAAQATVFNFDLVYWEDTDNPPPTDPAIDQTAHFQIDDMMGSRTPPSSHFQSIRFDTTGQYFGFTGDAVIDLYPTASYGGFDILPWPADADGPDYDDMRSLWGDAVVGDDLDFPSINTGTFYMGDYGDRTGYYQVTITQAAPLAAPEPASWAMMLAGFGAIGGAMRIRKRAVVRFA